MARPASDIRERIVRAAKGRFLSEGVDGASLRRIAKEARTSVGMVHYYFETKDELFLAVVEEVYSVILGDLTEALSPERPVEERIRGVYSRIGRVTEDELVVIRLVVREALVSSQRLERVLERMQRGHFPLVLRLVADAFASGTFRQGTHPALALLSMMALGGPGQLLLRLVGPRLPLGELPHGSELSSALLSILLGGLGRKESEKTP